MVILIMSDLRTTFKLLYSFLSNKIQDRKNRVRVEYFKKSNVRKTY